MNQDTIQGKWTEIKGEIRNLWGKLTDDELESTKGNLTAVAGLIRQRYGDTKDDVSRKLDQLVERAGESAEEISEDFKHSMRKEKDVNHE